MITKPIILAILGALAIGTVGCEEKRETRKIVIQGPEEKHEIKIEKTEKHGHHDKD